MASLLRPFASASSSSVAVLWASSATLTILSLFCLNSTLKTSQLEENNSNDTPKHARLDVDLMDKIAAKPYLPKTKKRSVPKRLRLLSIDVPEMRTDCINGECRVNLSKIYSDGVAPPKVLHQDKPLHRHSMQEVIQKSLTRALVQCRSRETHRIGVELMEASISDLNPHNLRRTRQFGSWYKYDPGKYAKNDNKKQQTPNGTKEAKEPSEDSTDVTDGLDDTGGNGTESSTSSTTSNDENSMSSSSKTTVKKDGEDGGTVLASVEDEYDAPWNQYAWIQELQLRIGGRVQFGASMEPASRLDRLLFGSVYKQTVPSSRRAWEWFWLLPIFQHDPAGFDVPSAISWNANKPHAVIANGAAMQRVPGSLRFLQKTCQENKVPLYIIHDPRVWGGNTHQDLQQAVFDLRSTIKHNIVKQAMQGGSAFSRGRILGQAETELRWQAKDMGRRTREAVRGANDKLKQERENDWSKLTVYELEGKLVERRVISVEESSDKSKTGKDSKQQQQASAHPVLPTYTDGMIKLSKQCLAHEAERERLAEEEQTPSKLNGSTLPA